MVTVLGIQNAKKWSWSFVLRRMIQELPEYKFATILGRPKEKIDIGLVDFFNITLVQNVSTTKLDGNKQKIILRMGGLRISDQNSSTRFNDDLAEVGAVIATNGKLFEMGKRVNDNTFLIPNGVDLQLFKPRSQRQQPFNDNNGKPFVVGFVGNIDDQGRKYKGWDYYVQATLRLYPGIKTKHALFGREQILHDEMPKKFYHQIDCLVLPSVNEGCSNTVVEALACGVPVLITKVGFHGERLENGVNCLFVKMDIDDIITKIQFLAKTPELRMKLAFNGRIFAETNHNINMLAIEYHNVFQSVLSNLENRKVNRKENHGS